MTDWVIYSFPSFGHWDLFGAWSLEFPLVEVVWVEQQNSLGCH
jgi:hypothetical protein